jgi:hypothetical protein
MVNSPESCGVVAYRIRKTMRGSFKRRCITLRVRRLRTVVRVCRGSWVETRSSGSRNAAVRSVLRGSGGRTTTDSGGIGKLRLELAVTGKQGKMARGFEQRLNRRDPWGHRCVEVAGTQVFGLSSNPRFETRCAAAKAEPVQVSCFSNAILRQRRCVSNSSKYLRSNHQFLRRRRDPGVHGLDRCGLYRPRG